MTCAWRSIEWNNIRGISSDDSRGEIKVDIQNLLNYELKFYYALYSITLNKTKYSIDLFLT